MSLHKMLLEIAAHQARNEDRQRIDEWLKNNKPRFEAVQTDDGKCEMYLDGFIGDDFGGVSAPTFQRQLDALKDAKEITVHVNSPGGFIDDGMAMYNSLVRHSARIITNVTGQAASSASFIVQAGDERRMGEATTMFLHRALGVTYGNDEDHEKMAGYLKQSTENIANVYAKRSGRRVDTFLNLMSDDTQLNAQQALEHKLIDSIVPLKKPGSVQNVAGDGEAAYGYCPQCGAKGIERERRKDGNDKCENGHSYPSSECLLVKPPPAVTAVNAKSIIDRKLRRMAMEEV